MSKATYKFDLSDPDDRDEFLRTTKATDMARVEVDADGNFEVINLRIQNNKLFRS